MAGEPNYCFSDCCSLSRGVLVSSVFSWIIWLVVTCLFWPATFEVNANKYDDPKKNAAVDGSSPNSGRGAIIGDSDSSSSCTNDALSEYDLALATQIGTPCISISGLVVDTIALLRLGACTSCACPGKIADCVDAMSRSPLLLPKLVFHGLLVAFMITVLILTNLLYCPDAALLINIVAPVIIVFYTFHSVNVYRLRDFKKQALAGKAGSGGGGGDAVDGAAANDDVDDDDLSELLVITRRGVGRKQPLKAKPKPVELDTFNGNETKG